MESSVKETLRSELQRLRRRDKIITYVLSVAVSLLVAGGVFFYFWQNPVSSSPGYANAADGSGTYGASSASFGSGLSSAGGGCGSGGSSGGGCCGGGGTASGTGTTVSNSKDLEKQALDHYAKNYAAKGPKVAKAEVTDFGCHIQVDLFDAAKTLIMSYAYRGGQLSPIQ